MYQMNDKRKSGNVFLILFGLIVLIYGAIKLRTLNRINPSDRTVQQWNDTVNYNVLVSCSILVITSAFITGNVIR